MSTTAREALERYGVELNRHDFDRLVPLLAPDCVFWFSSGTHRGLDQARRAFERTWARIQEEVYALADVQWIAESDQVAVCVYTFHWAGRIDGERREGRGRGTTCLRRDAGGWRIVHEHLSPFPG